MKVKHWVAGAEGENLDGLNAKFGALLPSNAEKALRLPAILANPANCCSNSSSKVISVTLLTWINFLAVNQKPNSQLTALTFSLGILIFF